MLSVQGKNNTYMSMFNENNGYYLRSGLLKNGKDTKNDVFMADFPETMYIDLIGKYPMPFSSFEQIAKECQGKTYQFALGGGGAPEGHPQFAQILECSRSHHIIPNIITPGLQMTPEFAQLCQEYCGAVTVNWVTGLDTVCAVQQLLQAGVQTNIQFVLNSQSLQEAVQRLTTQGFPEGIHAVIFSLYKPAGADTDNLLITAQTPYLQEFFSLISQRKFAYKIGFDACMIPQLLHYVPNIDSGCIDACESGRWSAYLSSDLLLMPCRIDSKQMKWAVSIQESTIEDAWNSEVFQDFRRMFQEACPACKQRHLCMGGCPICPELTICPDKNR